MKIIPFRQRSEQNVNWWYDPLNLGKVFLKIYFFISWLSKQINCRSSQ